ncbi:MAG: hypothetical protein ACRD4Q_00190 [Candidatus Acidiferrales bacterium]
MARHPEWFARLEAIAEAVRQSEPLEWLGRKEMRAIFNCSERDAIRLLHRFGAEERADALSLSRSSLLVQLEAIQTGDTYAAFLRQRQDVAKQLAAARAEAAARRFQVHAAALEEPKPRFKDLPESITWRRASPSEPGRFEIRYDNGEDLMWQLAEFFRVAGVNREEFFAGTEPSSHGLSR